MTLITALWETEAYSSHLANNSVTSQELTWDLIVDMGPWPSGGSVRMCLEPWDT